MMQLTGLHNQRDKDHSREQATRSNLAGKQIRRGVNRVLALVEDAKRRKEPIMSVSDCEIDETDAELCEEHMHYRPCRRCKRQAEVERAEAQKEE